jgi:hypothetical protein
MENLNVLKLFKGLSSQQATRYKECIVSILPPLREAVIESTKNERISPKSAKRANSPDLVADQDDPGDQGE